MSKKNHKKHSIDSILTLEDMLNFGADLFDKEKIYFGHGTDNSWDEAVFLAMHVLNFPPDYDSELLSKPLTDEEKTQIINLFERRVKERVPAPYLTNEAWFAGVPFYVDERVLIPRSVLAEFIENKFDPWASNIKIKNILDIGTGCGCIAILSAMVFPDAKIDAVDVSNDALDVAKINVDKYELFGRVELIQSDVFGSIRNRTYDVIISNPPYVANEEFADLPEEYSYEPLLALEGGDIGLDVIEKILAHAKKHLNQNGLLIVEVGNSKQFLEERFPQVPFIWLEFESGDNEVFLLTYDQLVEYDYLI